MSSIKPDDIKEIIRKEGIFLTKKLGQNFLIDKKIIKEIVSSASLKQRETVLEVGPGFGALTKKLTRKASKVIAVEKDRKICHWLRKKSGQSNLKIICDDIFNLKKGEFLEAPYKVVSNIPYEITSPLLNWLFLSPPRPSLTVLVIQKELAQRAISRPPRATRFSVFANLFSSPKLIKKIPPGAFWPAPKVDSAILILSNIKKPGWIREEDIGQFLELVKSGFSSPRKKIQTNLRTAFNLSTEDTKKWLTRADVDGNKRAEQLEFLSWKSLFLAKNSPLREEN